MGSEGAEDRVGRRIHDARTARGWTHEELARRMGVNWRTVQRWQKGRPPRVQTLRRLATVLDVPTSYFLEDDDELPTLSELRDRLSDLSERLDRLTESVAALVEGEEALAPAAPAGRPPRNG